MKRNPMHWFMNFIIRVYTRIVCRIDAPDIHTFPDKGPLIAYTNHTGQIEVPMLFAHLQPRDLTGWAKMEAWKNPFLRWVFSVWGAIPVHRGEADMKALKLALKALEEGKIFGLAPEGTRNYNGKLKRALPGAAMLAIHSGAPIIPVAHWGGENLMKNLKSFKRTDFHIRVGKPLKLKLEGIKITSEVRQEIVDEMMRQVAQMLPEEYRGEYANLQNYTGKYLALVE